MTEIGAAVRGLPAVRGRWTRLALALVAGALLTAGHPPVGLPWTLFAAVPVLVWLAGTAPTVAAAAWVGWAAGFGYFVTALHWIGHAFMVEPDQFALLMPLGVLLLPGGLALYWAAAFAAARWLWPSGMLRGTLLLAALWTAAEVARSFLFTGFPWALPGYVWVDLPPMQAAAWVGPFGMTLLTLVLCGLPLTAALGRRWAVAAAALAAGGAIWAAGAARLPETTAYAPDAPVVRVVQPNAPQHLKFQPGHREEFYRRTLEATAAPADPALGAPDIVVWPETAVHFVPEARPEEVARIADAAAGATVILGALHVERSAGGDRWTNALETVLPDGSLGPRYDKHHLVPFGEYMPLWPVARHLGLPQFTAGPGFAAGPGPRTLAPPGVPPFSALICYEAIFAQEVVADGRRPDWMVQLTNDAWFGSFAGPQQHYAQARIRAIEQGLPIVRAANTGISAVVDSHGREVSSLPLDSYGKIDSKLPSPLPPTLYSRIGDLPALVLVVILILFEAVRRRKRASH
jgi:apolipoprotein N-acyltransferase